MSSSLIHHPNAVVALELENAQRDLNHINNLLEQKQPHVDEYNRLRAEQAEAEKQVAAIAKKLKKLSAA
jgi:hypothetical protein